MPDYRDDEAARAALISSLKQRAEAADALAARVRDLERENRSLAEQVEALRAEVEELRGGAAAPAAAPPALPSYDFGPEFTAAREGECWSDAVEILARLIDASPDPETRLQAYLTLGDLQADKLADEDAALAAYQAALALDPAQPHALARVAALA